MPEPWPKLLVNREGQRKLVNSFEEQDAWTAKGYFRSLGRQVEHADAEAEQAKAKP